MDIVFGILSSVLPVLAVIAIGVLCRRKRLLDENGHKTIKNVIANITLPAVLFYAFFNADYSTQTLLIVLLVFAACVVAMLLGFLCLRMVKGGNTFLPYLVTGFEAGMMGYGLFTLLMGAEHTSVFAVVDIGQCLFVFTVFLACLRRSSGTKQRAKEAVLDIVTNPPCTAMLLGILCGATGIAPIIAATQPGEILLSVISFISQPTGVLILLVVGYELNFNMNLIKPVFATVALRLALMVALFFAVDAILFSIIPFDKTLRIALAVLFSLPPPFVIPIYAKTGSDGEYIAATFSLTTIVMIGLFAVISAYSNIT